MSRDYWEKFREILKTAKNRKHYAYGKLWIINTIYAEQTIRNILNYESRDVREHRPTQKLSFMQRLCDSIVLKGGRRASNKGFAW